MDQSLLFQVSNVLINTYNASQAIREDAERQLQVFLNTVGSASVLLSLIAQADNFPRDLRLAAALVVKNNVKNFWKTEESYTAAIANGVTIKTRRLSHEERQAAKSTLIQILLNETDNAMRKSIAETIKQITEYDPPESSWGELIPSLVEQIASMGSSPNPLRIYNSVVGLRQVLKRYQFSRETRRITFDSMIQVVFPQLQLLLQQLAGINSLEAASVIHVSLKIFYSAVTYTLPKVPGVDVQFWMNLLAAAMNKPLPEASENLEPLGQPVSIEEREQWPWWKVKKWATSISQHLFARYGDPKRCADENMEFARFFKSSASLQLLGPCMNLLQIKSQGGFITESVQRNCLAYVSTAVELSTTYKVLKPYMGFLVANVLMPSLSITEDEIQVFVEDPIEFVRKAHSIMEDFIDPAKQAQNLLQSLARYRPKDSMPFILETLHTSVRNYRAALAAAASGPPPSQSYHRSMDGVIVAVACISKILLTGKNSTYKEFVVQFVAQELIACLSSSEPFLRERACWAVQYLDDFPWGDWAGGNAALQQVLQGLVIGLRDPALPVQAAAACSMRTMIDAPGANDFLRPMLKDLIGEFFRIMADLESDVVLEALEKIIEGFPDEISSIAPMMVQHLLDNFSKWMAESGGDDDDEATWSAAQCLSTITALLECQSNRPDVLELLEPQICPLVHHLLTSGNGFGFLDQAMDIVHCLMGMSFGRAKKSLSPLMWGICGPMLAFLAGEGYDFIEEMRPCILSYMTRDVATFCSSSYTYTPSSSQGGQTNGLAQDATAAAAAAAPVSVSFVEFVLDIVAQAIRSDDSLSERDARASLGLLYVLVASAREAQCLHAILPAIMQLVTPRLLGQQPYSPLRIERFIPGPDDRTQLGAPLGCVTTSLKVKLLEVLLACFYYNTPVTVNVLSSDPACCSQVFRALFDTLPQMDQPITCRMVILALTSLLAAPPATKNLLPGEVRDNFGCMLQQCVRELELLRDQKFDEPCKDDEGFVDDGGDDDEDEDDDEDFDNGDGSELDDEDEDEEEDDGGVAAAVRRTAVPNGGYSEEDDIANTEDQSYLDMLAKAKNGGTFSSTKYIGGEPVDDDDDPYALGSDADHQDVLLFFMDTLSASPDAPSLQALLGPEDLQRLGAHIQTANERRYAAVAGVATT